MPTFSIYIYIYTVNMNDVTVELSNDVLGPGDDVQVMMSRSTIC